MIDQLDQRRARVLVESLIVEVSEAKAAEFGIQWMTGAGNINGGTSFIGGTNLGGSGLSGKGPTSIDALGGGMTLGVVKGTVDVLAPRSSTWACWRARRARPTSCPRRTC